MAFEKAVLKSLTKAANMDADPISWAKRACERPAVGQAQRDACEALRNAAIVMIINVITSCPPCADRTAAVRKVREALFAAQSAVETKGEI